MRDPTHGLMRLADRRRRGRLWTWNRAAGTSYEISLAEREARRCEIERRASLARLKNQRNYTLRQETAT